MPSIAIFPEVMAKYNDTTMEDFFLRALAGGIGVALAAGPVGCFVVWRRMAFLGTALAHTLLLGVALSFLLAIEPTVAVLVTCLLFAGCMALLERRGTVPLDSLLGVLAHLAFALGLIATSFMEQIRVDLLSYLLGDILSMSLLDLALVFSVAAVTGGLLIWQWRNLLAVTAEKNLAAAEGVPVTRMRLMLVFLLAAVIAVGMKLVGMLLVVALVIIPAAAARRFAATPEQMIALATLIGVVSSTAGLFASLEWDLPAGPAIVLMAGFIFVAGLLLPARDH